MADERLRTFMFSLQAQAARRRKLLLQQAFLINAIARRRSVILVCCLITILLTSTEASALRSCRRLHRNLGWWDTVWRTYSDARFKKTFRISRATFQYIVNKISGDLHRQIVAEDPISPECRLGICLYRLGRGDYYYTNSEMTGFGLSTISTIVLEVCEAIVKHLWAGCVTHHFPKDEAEFKEKMLDFEELWQFPCCWGGVDGRHIPIKCPKGGAEARKEYYNFKNFYSIVLMSLVDAKYRFMWGSCGFPGNSHDSIIFQSTSLWEKVQQGTVIPNIGKVIDGVRVSPVIVGDSAFQFSTWLMKPYTNAILSQEQRYFNYRLSRARMVTEGAYGQLKGR